MGPMWRRMLRRLWQKGRRARDPSCAPGAKTPIVEQLEPRVLLSAATLGDGISTFALDDADGDRVVFSLQGPGTADITLEHGASNHADVEHVELKGTTARSRLTIRVRPSGAGDGQTTLGTIEGHTVGVLDMPGVRIHGGVHLAGSLARFRAEKLDAGADLIVADHVNHLGESSLIELLDRAKLRIDEIDGEAHQSAWVVRASKAEPVSVPRPDVDALRDQVTQMSEFWSSLADRIHVFEMQHNGDTEAAIYGSGFYGTFIASCLTRPQRVRCFLDRNPYRQGKELMDRPIVDPDGLDRRINTVYVGLNPTSAQQAIESISSWQDRDHAYFYL